MENFICVFVIMLSLIGWIVTIMWLAASGQIHKFILAMIILALGISLLVTLGIEEDLKKSIENSQANG